VPPDDETFCTSVGIYPCPRRCGEIYAPSANSCLSLRNNGPWSRERGTMIFACGAYIG